MKYSEAEAKAMEIVRDPGYMQFSLNHNTHLILPHADGIKLLEALGQAEYLYTSYSIIPEIRPMGADDHQAWQHQQLSRQSPRQIRSRQVGR